MVKTLRTAMASEVRVDTQEVYRRMPSVAALTRWSQAQQGEEADAVTGSRLSEGKRRPLVPTPDAVPLAILRRRDDNALDCAASQSPRVNLLSARGDEPCLENSSASVADGWGTGVSTRLLQQCERVWVDAPIKGAVQAVIVDLGRWWPGCTAELSARGGRLRVTLRGGDLLRIGEWNDALDGLRAELTELLGRPVLTEVDAGHRGDR